MKKTYFILLLMLATGVSAQTFDFSCETGPSVASLDVILLSGRAISQNADGIYLIPGRETARFSIGFTDIEGVTDTIESFSGNDRASIFPPIDVTDNPWTGDYINNFSSGYRYVRTFRDSNDRVIAVLQFLYQ